MVQGGGCDCGKGCEGSRRTGWFNELSSPYGIRNSHTEQLHGMKAGKENVLGNNPRCNVKCLEGIEIKERQSGLSGCHMLEEL